MKGAKSANYWQIDHELKNLCPSKGAEVLKSADAWEKIPWTREFFKGKPKEGYFIWVKEQTDSPLFSCVSISSDKVRQEMQNLLVIEKGLRAKLQGTCSSLQPSGNGSHKAQGRIILKDRAFLQYDHVHSWGRKNIVCPEYDFILGKEAKLEYSYKMISSPKDLRVKTKVELAEKASCSLKLAADCRSIRAEIEDSVFLKGKGSSGQVELKIVAREGSNILARSIISAKAESRGHLDCQGLLIDPEKGEDQPVLKMTPQLDCRDSKAQLTHEAAIGRISSEQLDYLRMRGLSEKEAIDLIINGFFTA